MMRVGTGLLLTTGPHGMHLRHQIRKVLVLRRPTLLLPSSLQRVHLAQEAADLAAASFGSLLVLAACAAPTIICSIFMLGLTDTCKEHACMWLPSGTEHAAGLACMRM